MFVPESTLFMGIQVQILSCEGNSFATQLDPNATIESVKQVALSYFYSSETSSGFTRSEQYRVIHPGQSRSLNDNHIVHEEKLRENDVLLIVKRRQAKITDALNDHDMKAPTVAEIIATTSHLQPTAAPEPTTVAARLPASVETAVDFQLELRKILISLVSVMSTLLQGDKDSDLICKEMQCRLQHRLEAASKLPEGFQMDFPPPPQINCNPMGIIQGLEEAKKREFRPNQKAVENLREMGFTDEYIFSALRACKNNKDEACEWMLGGGVIVEDVEMGLETNSHLFNALVMNPTIRLGLNSPKTLLAFLGILENPASANVWLTDTDTSPVLSAIFKIYHSEKHAALDL